MERVPLLEDIPSIPYLEKSWQNYGQEYLFLIYLIRLWLEVVKNKSLEVEQNISFISGDSSVFMIGSIIVKK
jgi:hypothetical protein